MSLTSFLKLTDVRERFNAEFIKPELALRGSTFVAPLNPSHAQLVGTAFDYVLRLHVANINVKVWCRPWVAERAVDRLELDLALDQRAFAPGVEPADHGSLGNTRKKVEAARCEFERCRKAREISDEFLRSTLLLAQLDAYSRSGRLGTDFGKTNESDVADLRQLLEAARKLPQSPFVATRVCMLNPEFGMASSLVGGADADLLVDDTLIELKTTKELEFCAETFRQLMGYYVLNHIGGFGPNIRQKIEIRHIGVYSSRFGAFATIPVASVVNFETFPAFVRWFKQRARRGSSPGVRVDQVSSSRARRGMVSASGRPS